MCQTIGACAQTAETSQQFSFRLQDDYPDRFEWVQENVRRVLPSFDHFVLEEEHGRIFLRWRGTASDKTFGAHLTSDGSLRFFALVTLLNLAVRDAAECRVDR